MNQENDFRWKRMRAAMDKAGLTSGQIAYRMNVTDGTVRCWTTGRHKISVDELVLFADIVDYPVDYFIYEDYMLAQNFQLVRDLRKMTEQVEQLAARIGNEPGYLAALSEEETLNCLQNAHLLNDEEMSTIRRIIRQADQRRKNKASK